MIITNKHNLPQAFVKMASEDYTFRDKEYRVTSLLKGLRETILSAVTTRISRWMCPT